MAGKVPTPLAELPPVHRTALDDAVRAMLAEAAKAEAAAAAASDGADRRAS